jgi:hypothetical protein
MVSSSCIIFYPGSSTFRWKDLIKLYDLVYPEEALEDGLSDEL